MGGRSVRGPKDTSPVPVARAGRRPVTAEGPSRPRPFSEGQSPPQTEVRGGRWMCQSGRQDLNLRPPAPEGGGPPIKPAPPSDGRAGPPAGEHPRQAVHRSRGTPPGDKTSLATSPAAPVIPPPRRGRRSSRAPPTEGADGAGPQRGSATWFRSG